MIVSLVKEALAPAGEAAVEVEAPALVVVVPAAGAGVRWTVTVWVPPPQPAISAPSSAATTMGTPVCLPFVRVERLHKFRVVRHSSRVGCYPFLTSPLVCG